MHAAEQDPSMYLDSHRIIVVRETYAFPVPARLRAKSTKTRLSNENDDNPSWLTKPMQKHRYSRNGQFPCESHNGSC